ncbi:MAG: hypothetical protein LBU05_04960 [Bifidobacteriaceae bacterium]|nr:hypothetical protein [Bifidobacteriaceae bacterium]
MSNGVQVIGNRLIGLLPDGAWSEDSAPTLALDDISIEGKTIRGLIGDCARLTGSVDSVKKKVLLGSVTQSAEILKLHGEFAQLFARRLIPYCTDFVQSMPLELPPRVLLELFGNRAWISVDVTGAHGAKCGAGANSLFPLGDLREAFLERLGDARRLVEVLKVRAFFTYTSRAFTVRFVPMVLTRGLPTLGLAEWLAHPAINLAPERRGEPKALEAAAGLISMILSATLLDVFKRFVKDQHGVSVTQDDQFLRLVAGEPFVHSVRADLVSTLNVISQYLPANESGAGMVAPEELFVWPGGEQSAGVPVQVGDREVRPLLELVGKQSASGQAVSMTLSQLAAEMQASPAAVSLALDVLNDNGAAKNTCELSGSSVSRFTTAAEFAGKYTGYRRCPGGGRLAAIERRLELDPDLSDDARIEAIAAL